MSDPALALVYERARKRHEKKQQRARAREILKNQGNDFFRRQRYTEAADKYEEAIRLYGRKPVLLSNLAAAYLKLEEYEIAEEVATEALIYDPKMTKARCRRGMARKEMGRCIGAAIDFDNILKHEPSHSEASRALIEVEDTLNKDANSPSDEEFEDEEYAWPVREILTIQDDGYDSDSASDSSDCGHTGNGDPCRAYNHEGCFQKQCPYSHAPDDKSVRDNLGKNVCLFYIIGACQHRNSCSYSHNSRYLPDSGRWWDVDPDLRSELRESVLMARDIRRDERYILSMVYELLYENGYGPPHDLTLVLDQGTRGREVRAANRPPVPAPVVSPPPTSIDKPFIMVVSLDASDLFQKVFSSLITTLQAKVSLITVSERKFALELLSSPHLIGVLVSDSTITKRKHGKLASALVEYTKAGGLVVFGGMFAGNIKLSNLEDFFRRVWGLPWKMGDYCGSTFTKVNSNETVSLNRSLPSTLDVKSVQLTDITLESVMYRSTEYRRGGTVQAPMIHAKFGDGYLGYIGDVNSEAPSTQVALAMFGLLDHKYEQVRTSKMSGFRVTVGSSTGQGAQTSSQPSSGATSSFVMLLSLEHEPNYDECLKDVLTALRAKTRVVQALTGDAALTSLASPSLAGVFVTDPGIIQPEYSRMLAKLVEYTKAGGLVVIGGFFSSHICRPDMASFFRSAWGLSWKMGSYHRATHTKNTSHETTKLNPSLPRSYSMKSVFLENINVADAIYTEPDYPQQSPVLHTKIGKGYLGYVGDVNAEDESTKVVLAMLGLLDHSYNSAGSAPSGSAGSPSGPNTTSFSSAPQAPVSKKKRNCKGKGKAAPQVRAPSGIILVISFMNHEIFVQHCSKIISAIPDSIRLSVLSDVSRIQEMFLSPGLRGVFIADPTITQKPHADAFKSVIQYVKTGGTVVFGGAFSSLINVPTMDALWERHFGLPFKIGSFGCEECTLNPNNSLVGTNPSLKKTYSVKAVHLRNVNPDAAVYSPQGDNCAKEAPAIYTRFGNGYVGWTGDVTAAETSVDVVLAMLRL